MTEEEAAAQLAQMPESRIKGCLLWLAGLFGAAVVIALLAIIFAFLTGRDDQTATPPTGSPPADGPASAGTGPTRSVVAPETAGGYERILEDTVRAGSGPTLADMHRSGLRNAVTGWYTTPGSPPEPQVIFYGGVLTRSLGENEVADAAPTRLDEAFRRLTADGVRKYDGTMRPFDAGPLGGQVRCTTMTSTGRSNVVCGWVDQWTVGYIFDSRRGRDEAEVAALLVKMRDDFEIVDS